MKSRIYTVKYALVQALYWAVLCAIMGFAVVYMAASGYSNSEIGVIMAISNLIVVVFQPALATLADRNQKLTLRKIISVFSICMLAAAVGMLFLEKASIVMTVCLIASMVAISVIQPFLNSIAVQLEAQGVAVNFGLCRSCGSVAYAVVSTVEGILIEKKTIAVVPVVMIILLVGLLIGIVVIGNVESVGQKENIADKEMQNEEAKGLFVFLSENKRFGVFLVGVVLIFYTHMITSNYLIQIVENVGGNSSHMGIASSIAAIVELPAMIFFVKLVKKIRCQTLLRISGVFFAVKYLGLFLAGSVEMIYVAQVFQFGAYALFIPAVVHYVSRLFGNADMIKGQSMVTTATTLGTVFASIIGGRILDVYGTEEMMFTAVIVAVIGVVLMAIGVENTEK